jgi:hypothetical protein
VGPNVQFNNVFRTLYLSLSCLPGLVCPNPRTSHEHNFSTRTHPTRCPQAAKHLADTPRKGIVEWGAKVAAAPGFKCDAFGPGVVGTVVSWYPTEQQWGVEVSAGGVRDRPLHGHTKPVRTLFRRGFQIPEKRS